MLSHTSLYLIQITTQNKTEEKEKELDNNELKCNKNCQNIVSLLIFPSLKNGLDFLLMNENDQTIHLKNNEWNNCYLGIYLFGKNIILTVNYDKTFRKEFGHMKIKTSHLWIKQIHLDFETYCIITIFFKKLLLQDYSNHSIISLFLK
ncbi:hypothetical protein RFI_21893 [Reticulomyxa filosa]|uniref:Uncharacterized protein n=1 Tax=Reticulomyxa filosa TaxID=46433 RepID=X6MP86_RETFI|nr:hypothetical protein RFI_21893 [Reticulomyxa filosa]|eukprot:ETO15471.1 hypothetical protein RFI_21893 [Reticulomyxa filosa]